MSSDVPESIGELPLELRGMYPGLWWNEDRYSKRLSRLSEIRDKIPKSDVVALVDSDCDGRACEVVLRDKFEDPTVIVSNGTEYGISTSQALEVIAEEIGSQTEVYIADICPGEKFVSFVNPLYNIEAPIYVFDHHDWGWSSLANTRNATESIYIRNDKCAAQILQEEIHTDADDMLVEFLDVTADHDLYKKNDERSNHLSTLSFCLPRNEYVENALKFGADMVSESETLKRRYEVQEEKAEQRAQEAVNQAEWIDIQGRDIAITYFNCHQSRVGDYLLGEGADLSVIIQPTLHASFRSSEDFPVCSELARGLGGGGHKDAAGCSMYSNLSVNESINIADYEAQEQTDIENGTDVSDMDKFEYVRRTQGEPAKQLIKQYLISSLG